MTVWMILDPETERVALLSSEPGDSDFPRGLRGRGWEVRRGTVPDAAWADLMAARLTPDEQTALHLETWSKGTPA